MQIGLNSGAITAPMLRHEKGRLQLFGDTVNMSQSVFAIVGFAVVSIVIIVGSIKGKSSSTSSATLTVYCGSGGGLLQVEAVALDQWLS